MFTNLKSVFTKKNVVRIATQVAMFVAVVIVIDIAIEGTKAEYHKFAEFYGPKSENEEVAQEN